MRACVLLCLVACGSDSPGAAGPDASAAVDAATTPDAVSASDAGVADECAPLPAPTGAVVNVSPSDDLADVVQSAAEGSTLLLADGTYRGGAHVAKRGITIRSASGKRDAVILDGEYTTAEILLVSASDVTIAHLTIKRARDHLVHVVGGASDVTGTVLHDLALFDAGEQLVKVNTSGRTPNTYADRGRVTCSHFEMTAAGRPNIESLNGTSCYTGGIDAHQARGWRVARSTFVGIYCENGFLAEHAIHFWTGSRDTVVEQNVILDCARGIGFGLVENGASRPYADDPYPGVGYVGHYDGIIRNNFLWSDTPRHDTGIELAQARGVKVFHNTVVDPQSAFSSIDVRFANARAEIKNNIYRKLTERGGVTDKASNLETSDRAIFAKARDPHLASGAAPIDKGMVLDQAGLDIDGEAHAHGAPDIGADEHR